MKLPTGPRTTYITEEMSILIGDLQTDGTRFTNYGARLIELVRLGALMESRRRSGTDKRRFEIKKEEK